MAWGRKGINEGHINVLFKWLRIDGSSPLGINSGRRNGIFIVCPSISSCLLQQPSGEDGQLRSLFPPLTKPFGTGPWLSLLPCPLRPGLDLPDSLWALAMTRAPQPLRAAPPSETLHTLLIFLDCFPQGSTSLFFKTWPRFHCLQEASFWPSCPLVLALWLSHSTTISSHICPLYCDSLRDRPCLSLFCTFRA